MPASSVLEGDGLANITTQGSCWGPAVATWVLLPLTHLGRFIFMLPPPQEEPHGSPHIMCELCFTAAHGLIKVRTV